MVYSRPRLRGPWPLYFTRKLRKGYEDISFVTRGNPVRLQVPSWALYQVFKEIFISDFYDIDVLLKKLPAPPMVVDIGANAGCISVPTIEVHELDKDQRNVSHLARYLESQMAHIPLIFVQLVYLNGM